MSVARVDVDDIKARVDIRNLLPTDLMLVRAGRDAYRAKCPIHGGEHLSFGIKLAPSGDWIFNCWACGEKGNVFRLVMLLERCTFKEAKARLSHDVAPLMSGPAPKRKPPALLLACDALGCGETLELEEADRPYIGRTIAVAWLLRARRWYCPWCAAGQRPGVRSRQRQFMKFVEDLRAAFAATTERRAA